MATYKSTRGGATGTKFEEVLLAAYAPDGGLYIPETLPLISTQQFLSWGKHSFPKVCAEVLALFTTIDIKVLQSMTQKAYSNFNEGRQPIPMTTLEGNVIVLDASVGPTLSFKDIGQQVNYV